MSPLSRRAHDLTRPGLAAVLLLCLSVGAQGQKRGPLADEPLVSIASVDPSTLIDLRYAGNRNVTGKPIYPPETICLVRRGVAERLKVAQAYLVARGYKLKVWDAYRPLWAQRALFDSSKKNVDYVADPKKGMALHSWGVAVDVSLVTVEGKDVSMPTDFDEFSSSATMFYTGTDPAVGSHLRMLQRAMGTAGFYGLRDEWWHFIAKNWTDYGPVADAPQSSANR